MILADTSVWVDHFRATNRRLAGLLSDGQVACHPFVVGELACGNLRDRDTVLNHLRRLPAVPVATHEEALLLVATHRLAGAGLGWIDMHLLASALLGRVLVWSLDGPLQAAARRVGCAGPSAS